MKYRKVTPNCVSMMGMNARGMSEGLLKEKLEKGG
jgi:hypothetical protein